MKRDPREFISDVIEANHAIQLAVAGLGLEGYCNSRLIRSFGEREFTIVGVTLSQLSRSDAALFAQIDQAPQIISFRNKLTHEYFTINDQLVWCVIKGTYLHCWISAPSCSVISMGQQLSDGHVRRDPLAARRGPVQRRRNYGARRSR